MSRPETPRSQGSEGAIEENTLDLGELEQEFSGSDLEQETDTNQDLDPITDAELIALHQEMEETPDDKAYLVGQDSQKLQTATIKNLAEKQALLKQELEKAQKVLEEEKARDAVIEAAKALLKQEEPERKKPPRVRSKSWTGHDLKNGPVAAAIIGEKPAPKAPKGEKDDRTWCSRTCIPEKPGECISM